MKNEDECFLLRKAQNTECVIVYDGFFDPIKGSLFVGKYIRGGEVAHKGI